MNWLSWLLLLADTLNNVATLFLIFGTGTTIGLTVWLAISLAEMSSNRRYNSDNKLDRDFARAQSHATFIKRLIWLPVLLMLLGAMVPSRDTFYAIAASEVGEEAMKTPTFSKATTALNRWLDRQMATPQETHE